MGGRKYHVILDMLGLLHKSHIHALNITDYSGAQHFLERWEAPEGAPQHIMNRHELSRPRRCVDQGTVRLDGGDSRVYVHVVPLLHRDGEPELMLNWSLQTDEQLL